MSLKQFLSDNHDVPQLAHLLALLGFIVSVIILGFGLYLILGYHPDGMQTLFIGGGLMAGSKTLEGVERKIEGPGK